MLFGVITVSDRCSRGEMADTAGPAVAELVKQSWPGAEISGVVLPDEEELIAMAIEEFCVEGAALVLTVGGTGLGPRDHTPEATRRVMDREAPGLAEAMRALGAAKNQFAWLSRGVAGMKGTTLILNLPGSERGAVESLGSVLKLLRHGLDVAAGGQRHP